MDSKSLVSWVIMVMMVCGGRSDFAQDRKRCQDQLVSLSSCIEFVSGDAKAPTKSCCSELSKDVIKSKLCLCILVKDRNEPQLGFKLNATLALTLIPLCHIPSDASVCPQLLELAPNSPEAQIFEQFNTTSSAVDSGTFCFALVFVVSSLLCLLLSHSCQFSLLSVATDTIPSSSTKGLRQAAIHGVVFTCILLSVFITII
ncbi:UNVERIFIED_CONTAM: protein YLS3 [Sesamum angustifolium]|uniref:Protein YLS3 n=1 Tax=Sesamum angustifolium TaxID=2727405 RepID=A0AAW2PVA1_9LAMI